MARRVGIGEDYVREDLGRDGTARLLVFRVGDERYAVALRAVDAVIETPAVERLPDAASHVAGVSTVRGELVMVYDPHSLLCVAASPERSAETSTIGGEGAALLFRRSARRVGLLVDDVFDAVLIETAELKAVPGIAADDAIIGLVRRGAELIAVLDSDALLDAALAGEPMEERRR